jgi:hypothetical protein
MNIPPTRGDQLKPPERVRSAFSDVEHGSLEAERIHRFVQGIDPEPRAMTDDEVAQELNDPFAARLLRRGTFPTTLEEIITAVDAATAVGDSLRRRMSFLVGEGTQIPWSDESASIHRGLRLAVTFGRGDDIDLLVSTDASALTNDFLQVIGWDSTSELFNYYERVGTQWVWAGNSTHALDPRSRGKGPFDSHVNGSLVMKELKAPWTHWASMDATVDPNVFPPDDPMRTDPLFTHASGAEIVEARVVRPGVRRWTDSRFARTVSAGRVDQADRLLRHLFETTTVNLVSAGLESRLIASDTQLQLPPSFFLDTDAIVNDPLELPPPPNLVIPGEHYLAILEEFDVALVDGDFRQPGDTHFAFLVPERSVEDLDVVRKCVETELLSPRFVGCVLLVDFPNPIFSERRASLARFAPSAFDRSPGRPLGEAVGDAIAAAAGSAPDGSAEREFSSLWQLGDGWRAEAERRLSGYYAALAPRLASLGGARDVFRLAESRRARFFRTALAERRPLLLARSSFNEEHLLEMGADALVRPVGGS